MAEIAFREPALKPLCQTIVELRSISVFLNTFVNAELDSDNRMRSSFSVAGPTTFRFSSSENAFGSGMNLQIIPKGAKAKIKSSSYVKLPNIRRLFIPDHGYTFFDIDLDRADLQVVVWEADDTELKTVLRTGLDLHCVNAVTIFDVKGVPIEHLRESHPNYKELRGKIGEAKRDKCKAGVHATNYGVFPRKLAATLGITIREAEEFIAKWFGAHPGIRRWHLRTATELELRGYIENKFGARIYKIGRVNLPEYYAWLPQSTVAGVINRALCNIDAAQRLGETSILLSLQVHDSLAGQFLSSMRDRELANLVRLASIPIPYSDPLIIPVGIKTSTNSWGDCQ
jgi:DNA polymerase-1